MYKTLAPDCIGHRVGLEESAPLAEKYGFKGYRAGGPDPCRKDKGNS